MFSKGCIRRLWPNSGRRRSFTRCSLEICLHEENIRENLTKHNVKFAGPFDVDDWMALARLAIDGYPRLKKAAVAEYALVR